MSTDLPDPPGDASGIAKTLQFLGWLLAYTLATMGPWFQPLLNFKLISDYFQPHLNAVVCGIAVIALGTCHAAYRYHRTPKSTMFKHLFICWIPVFIACLVATLLLTETVGVTWDPGQEWVITLRIGWILLYILLFISYSAILCLLALLLTPNPFGGSKKKADGSRVA